jgi:hypothetical protein
VSWSFTLNEHLPRPIHVFECWTSPAYPTLSLMPRYGAPGVPVSASEPATNPALNWSRTRRDCEQTRTRDRKQPQVPIPTTIHGIRFDVPSCPRPATSRSFATLNTPVEYRNVDVTYGPENFPAVKEAVAWSQSVRRNEPLNIDVPAIERAKRYLRRCRRQLLANTATSIRSRLLPARQRIRARRRPGATRVVGVEQSVRAAMVNRRVARQASPRRSVWA